MQELPHHYAVTASAGAESHVVVSSPGLEDIATAAPAEYGGPGDVWSPQTFLFASVADCFLLTFPFLPRAAKTDRGSLRRERVGQARKIGKG